MAVQCVRAAGLSCIGRVESIEYLMMKGLVRSKHWTPPKGHVDPGEDLKQTALRETAEEAGLVSPTDIRLVEDFYVETKYDVKSHIDGIVRPKVVTYFLAELNDPNHSVTLSDEHEEFKWLSLEKALEIGGLDNMMGIFRQCESKIQRDLER